MESLPAAMTETSRRKVTALRRDLPEDIVVWEILVRLSPKSLLRCRAVCLAWRRATSTRTFLQAHHGRQPCLPVVFGTEYRGAFHENILVFDHRATGARLQPIARLDDYLSHEASCDGLLILSKPRVGFSVYNPVTRQITALRQLSGFILLGMYLHRPTGEYRLLLRQNHLGKICSYIFPLGSATPPKYIKGPEAAASVYLWRPALVRDSLHWYPRHSQSDPLHYQATSRVIIVFDTTSELFRRMRAPVVPVKSYTFEMDGTLGIYSYSIVSQTVDIWMLHNYESEVWRFKCRVKLPVLKIKETFVWLNDSSYVDVHSVDGDVLLLVSDGGLMFYVDIDGKLVDNFHHDGQHVFACELRLKQTLVQHTFFTAQ